MSTTDILCSGLSRPATEETMLVNTELLGPVEINPDGIADS